MAQRTGGLVVVKGHVSLVGAGPGDLGLLTRKAIARLRTADLVLYDALIDDRVLRYARRAQKFFVGKRGARGPREDSESSSAAARASGGGAPRAVKNGGHAMSQEAIHRLMIRAARRGRRVVRLKGGDPFVFGRGGEEALALQRAGVPYDVVPGVSSAIAAPASAGIPVTHRGVSSAFLVVSGHDETAFASAIDQVLPNQLTIVILMGLTQSAALACVLVDRGWSRGTPAAVIVDGTRPQQRVWRGTLDDLAFERVDLDSNGPATIVVGDVVAVGMQVSVVQARSPEGSRSIAGRARQ
jgi:uroporphyrin-III C-methyltransferase/precorrin-2 dehydrogenase/sirohydrochlorin ferrochelatase